MVRTLSLFLFCVSGLVFGCTSNDSAKTPQEDTLREAEKPTGDALKQTVVVYSGRSAKLVDPIFERFEQRTKIKVLVRAGKSDALANRIVMEADKTEADVIFLQESGYLEALGRKGLLQRLPEVATSRVPSEYLGTDSTWAGVSGRARVLVYSTADVALKDLPKSLYNLADDKWKGQIGWAPTNASFEAHVSALRHAWGEEKTKSWLSKMKALGTRKYPKNSPQVRAVDNGEIKIGWVNHYYLLKQKASKPQMKAANYSFPIKSDPGNLMMLSGVGITKNAKHKSAAEQFVAFLLSDEIQEHLTTKNFEYPVVHSIKPGPGLEDLAGRLSLIPQSRLTDIGATQKLLKDVGLR